MSKLLAQYIAKGAGTVPESGSLARLLLGMRHFGVGAKVTRTNYLRPECYFIITSVEPTGHRSAYIRGRHVWRGVAEDRDREVRKPLQKIWKLLSVPDYETFKGTAEECVAFYPPPQPVEKSPSDATDTTL